MSQVTRLNDLAAHIKANQALLDQLNGDDPGFVVARDRLMSLRGELKRMTEGWAETASWMVFKQALVLRFVLVTAEVCHSVHYAERGAAQFGVRCRTVPKAHEFQFTVLQALLPPLLIGPFSQIACRTEDEAVQTFEDLLAAVRPDIPIERIL